MIKRTNKVVKCDVYFVVATITGHKFLLVAKRNDFNNLYRSFLYHSFCFAHNFNQYFHQNLMIICTVAKHK